MTAYSSYIILIGMYIFLAGFSVLTFKTVWCLSQPVRILAQLFLGLTALKSGFMVGFYIESIFASINLLTAEQFIRLIADYINVLGYLATVVVIRAITGIMINQNVFKSLSCPDLCKNYETIDEHVEDSVFSLKNVD